MRVLSGAVISRYQYASRVLPPLVTLIGQRLGIPAPFPGTLNVQLGADFIVTPDAIIAPNEYRDGETLKLKRCRVRGLRCGLLRPDTHELPGKRGADVLEILSEYRLRDRFNLQDGDTLTVEVDGDDSWWNAPEA